MAKRKGLGGVLGLATQAKEQARYADDYLTTAIHIPRETHKLLRAVAFKRAIKGMIKRLTRDVKKRVG